VSVTHSSSTSKPDATRPPRSSVYAIDVVANKRGWFINLYVDGSPSQTYGPFDAALTIAQAFLHVGTTLKLGD